MVSRTDEELRAFILANHTVDSNGCWIWNGAKSKSHGYARIRRGGVQYHAQQVSYALFVGRIPKGIFVCHKCDVHACCNPEHLFLGTCADNNRDRAKKGRSASGEKSGVSKLSEIEIAQIKDLYHCRRFTYKEIATQYCVSASTLWSICTGVGRIAHKEKTKRDDFESDPICKRCLRRKDAVKSLPVNGYCGSCYVYLRKKVHKEKLGIKTRQYTHKKKFDLSLEPHERR